LDETNGATMSETIDALTLTWATLLLVYGTIAIAVLGVRWVVRQVKPGGGGSVLSVK